MEIYSVRINGQENPMGMLLDPPVVSWKVRGATGKRQIRSTVEIASDEAFSHILWQTEGETLDSLSEKIQLPLTPRKQYFCRIKVISDAGETAVSPTCRFETGKMDEPWQGRWIGIQERDLHPVFFRSFQAAKPVSKARLYICGLGLFEAYINGVKAGEDRLAPFINDYLEHFQTCTYDVTGAVREDNEISVLLGQGWYLGRFGLMGISHPQRRFALIAELHLRYSDGTEEVIGTDENWAYQESAWDLTDIYDGEVQDWTKLSQEPRPAVLIDPPGKLTDRYSPPLTEHEHLPVQKIIHTPAGETVLDFGQNFAGIVRCTQPIPAGTTMTMEFGEILQNGCFYHDNYRTAKSSFIYISDGKSRTVEAHFTFFGFRYVKVTGIENVDPACFTGVVLHSKMERTGFLVTGNAKINRLHENALWGLKSNFLDMPTDCPQRDERLGWTGDTQVFAPTAGYLMDTRAFYDKFLRDLRSDQVRNSGKVAVYIPNERPGMCASVWSDIATFLPRMLWHYYGDKTALARYYPMMRDWVETVRRMDRSRGEKHLWDFGFQFGDWLALDGATDQSMIGRTDTGFLSSCYYFASASYTAQAAEFLGYEEALEYRELAEAIKSAILREYFTPTGRLAVDTQTGYLLALRFGIYMDREKIIAGLRQCIRRDCHRIRGGFVGATVMNTVLADNDMTGLAYDFLLFEGFPGWLYAVNLGATTIWERWNSVLSDGTISGTGMNSLNHYAYGSVVEFLYRHSAGIQPTAPGFREVRLAPKPDARLGKLHCRYESASGTYVSQWEIREDGLLYFHFEIPFGCKAVIDLPEQEEITVTSGTYDYTISTEREYRCPYSEDTTMQELLKDSRAVEILGRHLPGVLAGLNRDNPEDMSASLGDIRRRTVLLGGPGENFDRAMQEIGTLYN